MDGEGENSG